MRWYLKVLRQYADFSGRARRTELWMFVLVNGVISIVLSLLDHLLGLGWGSGLGGGALRTVYSLIVLVPNLAVGARRLHDIGRSGWWLLIGLVPVVGWIVLIVWCATDGIPQPNAWGANPKLAPPPRPARAT